VSLPVSRTVAASGDTRSRPPHRPQFQTTAPSAVSGYRTIQSFGLVETLADNHDC